jgi:hypothetical protein
MSESLYSITASHRKGQERAYNQAMSLLRQGMSLAEVVAYLRTAYRELWYKWRVSDEASLGESRRAERQSFRTQLDS